jgi:hypothetical protein
MLKRIDELYESAFEGPSPGQLHQIGADLQDWFFDEDFPEEDAAENDVQSAELHYEEVRYFCSDFKCLPYASSKSERCKPAFRTRRTFLEFSIKQLGRQMLPFLRYRVYVVISSPSVLFAHRHPNPQANRHATYDTFSVGGIWTQMAEHDDLLRAQAMASQASSLVRRARNSQPIVNAIECPPITSP